MSKKAKRKLNVDHGFLQPEAEKFGQDWLGPYQGYGKPPKPRATTKRIKRRRAG
jgi:hypothetical protein